MLFAFFVTRHSLAYYVQRILKRFPDLLLAAGGPAFMASLAASGIHDRGMQM